MCLGAQNFAAQSHEAVNSLELPLYTLCEAGPNRQSSTTFGSGYGPSSRCKVLVLLMLDPSENG